MEEKKLNKKRDLFKEEKNVRKVRTNPEIKPPEMAMRPPSTKKPNEKKE